MPGPLAQAHPFQRFHGSRLPLFGRHAPEHQGKGHVFQSRQFLQQLIPLKHKPDLLLPHPAEGFLVQPRHIHPIQPVSPRRGRIQTADQVHQRAFAAAAGPHNGHILSPPHLKRNIIQHPQPGMAFPSRVFLCYAFHADHIAHLLIPGKSTG